MPDYRSNALFSDVEPSYVAEEVLLPAQDVAGVALDAVFISHEPPQKNFLNTVSPRLETQQAAVSGANYLETPFSDKQVVETSAPKGSILLTNFTHS